MSRSSIARHFPVDLPLILSEGLTVDVGGARALEAEGVEARAQRLAAEAHACKRVISDAGDAVWDRHVRQSNAVIEGPLPNAGNTVGDRNVSQTTAVSEGGSPNAGDRLPLITGWDHQRTGRIFIAVRNGNAIAVNYIGQGSTGLHRLGVTTHQLGTEQGSDHQQQSINGSHHTTNQLIKFIAHHLNFYPLNIR